MMDFKLYDSYKAEKKRHMSGNHVKMKIPEYLIELYEGKYPFDTGRKRKIVFLFLQNFQRYTLMHLLLLNQWNDFLVLLDRSSDQIHVDADLINPHFKC